MRAETQTDKQTDIKAHMLISILYFRTRGEVTTDIKMVMVQKQTTTASTVPENDDGSTFV